LPKKRKRETESFDLFGCFRRASLHLAQCHKPQLNRLIINSLATSPWKNVKELQGKVTGEGVAKQPPRETQRATAAAAEQIKTKKC
jgi:hypothetical protein